MASSEVKQITSFDELASRHITIEVERADGSVIAIPIRTLTYGEWQRIGNEVQEPTPPVTMAGPKGKVFDWQDMNYLTAVQSANDQRMLRRLIASLRIDIPGDTTEDKIQNLLNTVDSQVVFSLAAFLGKLNTERSARVESRAATFPQGRSNGAAVAGQETMDTE